MERSEIIQWTRIMPSKCLILEHKTWLILTALFDLCMTCLYGQGPLSVCGQVVFTCLFNTLLSSLGRLTVTASFLWSVMKLFFLFLYLDSALSDWLEVSYSWGFLTKFRRLYSIFWTTFSWKQLVLHFNRIDGVITATDLQAPRKISLLFDSSVKEWYSRYLTALCHKIFSCH